jgi:signal transduction histidine kinase
MVRGENWDAPRRRAMTDSRDSKIFSALRGVGIDSRQVLDGLPDGITIQDREFTVVYQNAAMRDAFGDQTGTKCHVAYERRDKICEGCGLARAFDTGKPVMVLRTAFDAKGGTSYWENACFPIRDENGRIVAGAEVCRNVTGRVGLEAEVKQRNIELGQLNQELQRQTTRLTEMFHQLEWEVQQRQRAEMELRQAQKLQSVGQLAAGIAHEINTPVQYVADNIHFLAESFNDTQALIAQHKQAAAELPPSLEHEALRRQMAEAAKAVDLEFIQENAPDAFARAVEGLERIAAIVSAMKQFAHPDEREKSPADLNRAILATLTVARAEYKDVADVETELGELPLVRCYLGDLNQVFLNLLVNAAHAISDVVAKTGGRGRICVLTKREGDEVRIDIADTGCGIPEAIRLRVFDPFFTTKEVGHGTGQGLAIAHSITVDKHGGALTFESEVGKGTTFTLRIPISGS